jgi:hypothetical protein
MGQSSGRWFWTKDQASDDELGVNFSFTFHFAADPVDKKSGGTR